MSATLPRQYLKPPNKCTKMRKFWSREIEQQYEFYLASLRAHRDATFLVQEHNELLKKIADSESKNVNLRKELRLLELELYTICQRHSHDSVVIDALHEVDHQAEKTFFRTSEVQHQLDLKKHESNTHKNVINILDDQLSLLKRKTEEDTVVLDSLKPHEKKLREILDSERLTNHQQSMKYKRELLNILEEFEQNSQQLQSMQDSRSEKLAWLCSLFSETVEKEMEQRDPQIDQDTNSIGSSQGTEKFEVKTPEPSSDPDESDENQDLKKECSRFVATTEILNKENIVISQLIHSYITRLEERLNELMEGYISIYDVETEIALIKEYAERLHLVRKKQEHKFKDVREVELVEQKDAILGILVHEENFFQTLLSHYTMSMKEDFQFNSAFSHQMKNIFLTELNSSSE